jgi:hypothetical protein
VASRCEPGFFGAGADEFGWGFGLGEPYPRGQLNGLLVMAEIGAPGAWSRVFTDPNLAKFDQPTVSGVDFPRLGIREAWNSEPEPGVGPVLHIGCYAATAADRGAPTSFRVTQLPDAASCALRCDGAPYHRWRMLDPHSIEVDLQIGEHQIQVFGSASEASGWLAERAEPSGAVSPAGGAAASGRAGAPAEADQGPFAGGVPRPPCACC